MFLICRLNCKVWLTTQSFRYVHVITDVRESVLNNLVSKFVFENVSRSLDNVNEDTSAALSYTIHDLATFKFTSSLLARKQ